MGRTAIVYRSKNAEDWAKAKEILAGAGIEAVAFAARESPFLGCGGKVDVRRFLNRKPVPDTVFRLEVSATDEERAKELLAGKVLPVLSYGYTI